MATLQEREKNMKINYPITNAFFSKVDISRGKLKDRAKLVVEFIERCGTSDRHCCLAMAKSTTYCSSFYGEEQKLAEFENNGIEYLIFKLEPMSRIANFKGKALRAIESAEAQGGDLVQRKDAFKQAFLPDVANFIVVDRDHGFYSWFSFDNYFYVDRGDLRYYVWIYG